MKKVFIYCLMITMLASAFSGIIFNVRTTAQEHVPEVSMLLDYVTPVIAYADSDTVGGIGDQQPPPPPID